MFQTLYAKLLLFSMLLSMFLQCHALTHSLTVLQEAISVASAEMRDTLVTVTPRNTSWTGLRFMLAEIIYASFLTDPLDQQSLACMIDYWISPNAIKKDFELPRCK